jgi:phospholipase C
VAVVTDRDGNLEIYRMYPDGTDQENLTRDPGADSDPAWSPDGTKIAFTSDRTGNQDVWVMDADGADPVELTSNPADDAQPSWSPDGTKIAFTSDRTGNDEVFVMLADGRQPTNITHDPTDDSQPAWAPDGTHIVFTSDRTGDPELFVSKSDGSSPVNLTHDPAGSDSQAAWSPDGTRIAFTSTRDGDHEVYVMNADGTGQADLTQDPSSDTGPAFSPDGGTRIAFSTDRDGNGQIDVMNLIPGTTTTYGLVRVTHETSDETDPSWQPLPAGTPAPNPIRHIVVVFQENHSFDNVLGKLCVVDARCNGTTTGKLADGSTIPLPPAENHVPNAYHSYSSQQFVINGGQMNHWNLLPRCTADDGYACYQQFSPSQIPNLAALARAYAISDATYESDTVGSWGGHVDLVAGQLDGFYTAVPRHEDGPGLGWGCDSKWEADWGPTPTDPTILEPQCIPQKDRSGPYRATDVPWVPTIMDRMEAAGRSWKIYAPQSNEEQYGWALCPTFADCFYTGQRSNYVRRQQFSVDALAGHLPALSLVMPDTRRSQHNLQSMLLGDNYIQNVVSSVEQGDDWGSTAIFITYDDCGCFYDHVPPPPNLGIRVPMVIVSPYAKPGSTDSHTASYASMLAFTEHTFGLAPLSTVDATAYDYGHSFDYTQRPLAPIRLTPSVISPEEWHWIRHHMAPPDFT